MRLKKLGLIPAFDKVFGKNIKVSMGFSNKACTESINKPMLSVQSSNTLRRAGIDYIEKLIDIADEGAFASFWNMGTKSHNEIQTKILVFGCERLTEKEKMKFFEN